jgi:hypothetical protein
MPRSRKKVADMAEWTVMVYMAGDNNLDAAGVTDLLEMKKVGSSAKLNVLAQFDRAGGKGTTKRYRLRQGTTLAADTLADLGETNTGDPAVLQDFFAWGIKTYPARRVMGVLWNHGAGWDDSNLYGGDYFGGQAPPVVHKGFALDARGSVATRAPRKAPSLAPVPLAQARAAVRHARRALFSTTVDTMVKTRAIAFDDQAKDFLDNGEIESVMRAICQQLGRKIDILAFDACLMSMLEVGYQIKDTATYCVGSQEEEPNNGWPYTGILTALAKRPAMAPADLAKTVVTQYLASYRTSDGVTFSATDLGRIDAVVATVNTLGAALVKAMGGKPELAAIRTVRAGVQEYSAPYDDYVDLVDLCSGLGKLVNNADVTGACAAVTAAQGQMVLKSGFKGARLAQSHGLSIYFPKKRVCALYSTLDFTKKNAWATFLNAYVDALGQRAWG